jgi:hypothetical protein
MQQQRPGLPMQILSNNVRPMSRSCPLLPAMLLATIVFACNDELTQEVPEDVCMSMGPNYSVRPGTQWIGGRRASPEMYPGRDCVGCHLDNDGPELMFGGTVYPYEQRLDFGRNATRTPPTGDDCFGLEGVTVTVTGGDGQEYVTTTNAAGNFFLEGKASDLKKPYSVQISYQPDFQDPPNAPPMGEQPFYGGCGRCHSLDAVQFPPGRRSDPLPPGVTDDERVYPAGTKIGIQGLLDFTREM